MPLFFLPGLTSPFRLSKIFLLDLGLAISLLLGLRAWLRQRRNFPLLAAAAILLFLAASLFSLFRSLNKFEGALQVHFWLLGFAAVFLAFGFAGAEEKVKRIMTVAVFSALLVALIGLWQYFVADIPGLMRVSGPAATFGNKNMSAHFMALVLPLALFFFLSRLKRFLFFGAAAAIMAGYTFVCRTRAVLFAYLLALFVAICAGWWRSRQGFADGSALQLRLRRKLFFLAGIFFVLAIFIVLLATGSVAPRPQISPEAASGDVTGDFSLSRQNRLAMWLNSGAMIREHWLWGVGPGNWKLFYPLYAHSVRPDTVFSLATQPDHAHNDYLEILAETGVIGALPFFFLLGLGLYWAVTNALRSLDFSALIFDLALLWSYVAFLAIAAVDFPFSHPVQSFFFWLQYGVIAVRRSWITLQNEQQDKKSVCSGMALAGLGFSALFFTVVLALCLIADGKFSRGVRLWNSGNKAAGLAQMVQGSSLNFWNYRFRHTLALALWKSARPADSLRAAEQALRFHPNYAASLFLKGMCLEALGDLPSAYTAESAACRLIPNNISLRLSLVKLLVKLGRSAAASAELDRILLLEPANATARQWLAELGKKQWP